MSSSSRIPGFYRLEPADRRRVLAADLSESDLAALDSGGLSLETADGMIENVIGTYGVPLGVGINFVVNAQDYLVPMAIEEASVVAAASSAAKLVRQAGGFVAEATAPIMIAQIQLLDLVDPDAAVAAIAAAKTDLLSRAADALPRMVARGGGPVDLTTRILSRPTDPDGGMVVCHIHIDCRDAMGANLVNTVAETLAPHLAAVCNGRVGLRILTNLNDTRLVTVRARVKQSDLTSVPDDEADGAKVRRAIVEASRFADLDPYRAATHNKGIMNGIDAVLLATGNDWRGVEAGAHAFAAQSGRYGPLARWRSDGDDLVGEMTIPMAVGTVGGALHVHPVARLSLALLAVETATELSQVIAAVGLASNLAALRALATEGIQRGHMSLHARLVARAAGARGDQIEQVAAELAALGDVKADRAKEILERLRKTAVGDTLSLEKSR